MSDTDRPTGDDPLDLDGILAEYVGPPIPHEAIAIVLDMVEVRLAARAGKDAAAVAAVRALAERWAREAEERGPGDKVNTDGVAAMLFAALDVAPPTTDHDTTRADAWDEAVRAFAWCLDNGPAESAVAYVRDHNPYRADAVAQPDDTNGSAA